MLAQYYIYIHKYIYILYMVYLPFSLLSLTMLFFLLFLGCVPKFSFGGKSFQENACKEKKVAIQNV
ncbi:hypothetical protein ACSBR1_042185 [Camellia fascicularis]